MLVTAIILLLVITVFGGGIYVWYLYGASYKPEVTRKWTDPKIRE